LIAMLDEAAESIGWNASKLFDERTRLRTAGALHKAGFKTRAGEWLGFASAASAFTLAIAILAAFAFTGQIGIALAVGFAFSALVLWLLHSLPFWKARERAELVEDGLSAALRTIATELGLNASFERAVESATRFDLAGVEFKRVLGDVKRGKAFPEALRQMGERVDSVVVKRACVQLSTAFEEGKAEGLRRLADETASLQRERLKRYAAKQGIASLAFIAVGGIIPAFFGAYAIIGSAFLEVTFTPEQILYAYLLGFPAADFIVLQYLRSQAPKVNANA